ncbi:hypothetical protein FOQG_18152 [Fusarium oxysporum f. sp. raphani 54005]|uniref:Aromatic amino acid beta-eliminating lyase/threonine aldolase domain-containing protein n=1 Tax=Fusarium oxysporum f. sp. raphani 54005 TaxID=1089458 RepID=X0B5T5_FUSOX|nr:hypothetical protein FOQG_18152 [Fusarium oxysporum f. sp. raphani 54005]
MSDNIASASPEIMQAIIAAATEYVPPYGNDSIIGAALSSRTAANCIGLALLIKPWGSILYHLDSHINKDKYGASEAFTGGRKLVTVSGNNSKLNPYSLRAAVRQKASNIHSIQLSVISIS